VPKVSEVYLLRQKYQVFLNPTPLVHCLYQMSPLYQKRTTSSKAIPIFYVEKQLAIKILKISNSFFLIRAMATRVFILPQNVERQVCKTFSSYFPKQIFFFRLSKC
jgi:hypothetical protein